MSLSPVITAAAALQRLDGVAGVMLFKGRNTIHRQMPFSETRADNLREIIVQMLDGYRQVRRNIRQIYMEFDGGGLLIVAHGEAVMLFFLTARADPDLAASAASVMLNDHAGPLAAASSELQPAAPSSADGIEELVVTSPRALAQITEKAETTVNQWGAVRQCVESVLGKVMGRAQAINLIQRTITEAQIPDPYRLNAAAVRKLAVSVIEHVPNTSKRRQLLVELDAAIEHLNI
ncbi:MAG: hypothetical protein IAE77_21920 [Prosthecobacter sp.]|jgi:hypothetical protein|uniref:hypothetical protein n=1 Tax=Prosthecobacter sp. TaxID=1965333 RepID=UPI0019DFC67A|nr:hypothetical protein [Prosthecobacter sp.]MBE2286129.1 hypothetical protein [Prosthecobacter sp.]